MAERAAPGRDRATLIPASLQKRDPRPPIAPFTERDSIASWRLSSHSSLSAHISTEKSVSDGEKRDRSPRFRSNMVIADAGLGEEEEAFAWLEKSFVARDKGLTYLKIDPCLDPLRSDSLFQDLVRRVGLPS
jgi:hypothetical protein